MFKSFDIKLLVFFVATAAVGLIPKLYFYDLSIHYDWSYFDNMSQLTHATFWRDSVLPLIDPWRCGGVDLIGHPETRLFSPTVVLDLLFSPKWANSLSLFFTAIVGGFGMFLLLSHIKCSKWASLLGAYMFINSNWFGLHFGEGHIPFGSLQLLPMTLYGILKIDTKKGFAVLAACLSFFALDGGIYSLIFTLLMLIPAIFLQPGVLGRLLKAMKRDPQIYLALAVSAMLFMSIRAVPLIASYAGRTPHLDLFSFDLSMAVKVFFSPLQSPFERPQGSEWRFHEFGCYVGFLIFLPIIMHFRKVPTPLFVFALLWLWIGTGFGGSFNPWRLIHEIPLIQNAHIQSRTLLIFHIGLLMIFARSFSFFPRSHWLVIFSALIIVESTFVSVYPQWRFFERAPIPSHLVHPKKLTSTTVAKTIDKPSTRDFFYQHNLAVTQCYEPALAGMVNPTRSSDDPRYQGEAYFIDSDKPLELKTYKPNMIEIHNPQKSVGIIEVNTRAWHFWSSDHHRILKGDLLRIQISEPAEYIRLQYGKNEMRRILASWTLAFFLMIFAIFSILKPSA